MEEAFRGSILEMSAPRTQRRTAKRMVLALVITACNAPFPPDARLTLGLQPTSMSVPIGGEQSAAVTLTRIGDYNGDVAITVDGLPTGVTAVATSSTSGQTTTATVTLRVSAAAKAGTFPLTVRAHAPQLTDATSLLVLTVIDPPTYALSLSKTAITIARGGSAPIDVNVARTNFVAGVALSVDGAAGITAAFAQNPATGESVATTISVGTGVAPATYTVTVRATAAGLTDRTATLTVTVIPDAIQLLVQSGVSGFQGTTGTSSILVNRGTFAGAIALTAEGLPTGATASFTPLTSTSASTTLTLVVGPTVPTGTYAVTIRASAAGVPDATAPLTLTVLPTVFSLSLAPQSATLLQGTTATSTLTIARTAIAAAVDVTVEGAPAGLTITPSPASTTGTSSGITIVAAPSLAAGDYSVTLRGTPRGLPVAASMTATLGVAVRATAPGAGNVVLDWSACVAPSWVAAQDDSGAWTQVAGASGIYRFDVQSGKGGFTYAENGNSIVVRYMSQAELTATPIDMCVGAPGIKTINGTAVHNSTSEQWVYRLGGGSGTSNGASPNFAITGVRNGTHDFITWGSTIGLGLRGLMRRDVDLPDGASLGSINLASAEAFVPVQRSLTINGTLANENLTFGISFLTTPACTVNSLFTSAGAGLLYGVPDALLRSTDSHMLTVAATTTSGSRSASEVFHSMANRTMQLPPVLAAPPVVALTGSYKRMEATIGTLPSTYNTSATLRLSDGTRTMSVTATTAYTGTTGVVLSTPDLSGVSGWPSALAIASGAHGNWVVSANGAPANTPLCTESLRTVVASQSGTF
jgi:hypothetical protein